MFHLPILVPALLSFFEDIKIKTFIDGTLGAGGHAKALLEAHPEIVTFYGLDQDPMALEISQQVLESFGDKVQFIHCNFRDLAAQLPQELVEGIFLDLGVSSMQLDRAEKGFSFSKQGPLDMRMDPTQDLHAAKVVNTFPEKELARIFFELGEEPKSRAAAKAIVERRRKKKLETTTDLTETLKYVLTWSGRGGKKIHPATRIFQALRIYVNDELGAVRDVIPSAVDKLALGGRLGILSFHSLEDRIVKHAFKKLEAEKKVRILTKKPLIASDEEIRSNPRSRSAKLRFLEKI